MVYTLKSYPHIIATLPDEGIPTYKRPVLNTLKGGGRVGNNSPIDKGSTVGLGNSFNCAIDVSSKLWSNGCYDLWGCVWLRSLKNITMMR
jgi:hypothetical protein